MAEPRLVPKDNLESLTERQLAQHFCAKIADTAEAISLDWDRSPDLFPDVKPADSKLVQDLAKIVHSLEKIYANLE